MNRPLCLFDPFFPMAVLVLGLLPLAIQGIALGEEPAGAEATSTEIESGSQSLSALKAEHARRSKYLNWPTESRVANFAELQAKKRSNQAAYQQVVRPVLMEACVECHGPETVEGNVRIDTLDPDLPAGDDVAWWLEVLAVLSNNEMPPPYATDLEDEKRAEVVEWLSGEIQLASSIRRATSGLSSFRRMTRYETNYALQDVLGLPWDFAKDLPPEAHSEDGFQNSSEMLHMSPVQLENYRQVARQALMRATVRGDRPSPIYWGITMKEAAEREWPKEAQEIDKVKKKYGDDPAKQEEELKRLADRFNRPHSKPYYRELSTGRTATAEWAYSGAKYAFAPSSGEVEPPESFDCVAILPPGHGQNLVVELGNQIPDEGMMRVRVRAGRTETQADRVPSLQLEFGFRASNEGRAIVRVSDEDTPIEASADRPQFYEWHIPLGEIYPRNAFRKDAPMGGLPSPSEFIRLVNSSVPQGGHGDIQIDYVEIAAPVWDEWPPPSHTRIFIASENTSDEAAYARELLTEFMPRAWRRSIRTEELEQKLRLFTGIREGGNSFDEAIVEVLATILSSPNFLYVRSRNHSGESTSPDVGLATRLSMFLWSSVPDAELIDLASSGKLTEPKVLTEQVDRMLADPRSERLAEHFVHQWLDMQLLDFLTLAGKSDPLLKEAMQEEPAAFFRELLKENASVLDFVHADFAVVNERLAQHYGIDGVRGNHFRRVELDDGPRRGGLLTQAGLLAMNSDGKDSHPLKRGVWLLTRLLNDPPPPPPPAVPEIDLADPEIAKMTLKERIEDHRNHAACMSCHAKIDPWGIAFENYDALGLWRDKVGSKPVDSVSELFNEQELNGIEGLKRYLLTHRQDQFVRAVVYKIATYALGRPLSFADHAVVDNITADVRRRGDGLGTILHAVVQSELFLPQ